MSAVVCWGCDTILLLHIFLNLKKSLGVPVVAQQVKNLTQLSLKTQV